MGTTKKKKATKKKAAPAEDRGDESTQPSAPPKAVPKAAPKAAAEPKRKMRRLADAPSTRKAYKLSMNVSLKGKNHALGTVVSMTDREAAPVVKVGGAKLLADVEAEARATLAKAEKAVAEATATREAAEA